MDNYKITSKIALRMSEVNSKLFDFNFSYTSDAPELYQRKLGDLAFLVQNYELAYNCYHTAKRDFNNEHAWFYFAGALVRMAMLPLIFSLIRDYILQLTLSKVDSFGTSTTRMCCLIEMYLVF